MCPKAPASIAQREQSVAEKQTKLHSDAEFVNDTAVIFYVGLVTRVVWCHQGLSGSTTTEVVKKSD